MTESPQNPVAATPAWPVVVGAALMAVWGVAQAAWLPSDGDPAAIAQAAARLAELPREIGSWTATDVELDREQTAAAGAEGILSRQYRDSASGKTVTVLLVCGRPSQIAVHPPTACYRGIGYEPQSAPRLVSFDEPGEARSMEKSAPHELAFASFARAGGPDAAVDVAWGWSADGQWSAPSSPRMTYAGKPVLYKLYIARERTPGRRKDDPLPALAAHLVEALRPVLNPEMRAPHDG
jgi:hypothetical protein